MNVHTTEQQSAQLLEPDGISGFCWGYSMTAGTGFRAASLGINPQKKPGGSDKSHMQVAVYFCMRPYEGRNGSWATPLQLSAPR